MSIPTLTSLIKTNTKNLSGTSRLAVNLLDEDYGKGEIVYSFKDGTKIELLENKSNSTDMFFCIRPSGQEPGYISIDTSKATLLQEGVQSQGYVLPDVIAEAILTVIKGKLNN